jgi:hypothetical protein
VGNGRIDDNTMYCAFLFVNERCECRLPFIQVSFHSAGAPMILHLEQRRHDQNRFRFYALDECRDLFGAATDLSVRKQRRGYTLLPEQLVLPLWD